MPIPQQLAAQHRFSINRLLHDTRLKPKAKKVAVWNYILHNEIVLGTQFIIAQPDNKLYAVLGLTEEVVQLPAAGRGGDKIHAYIADLYGLADVEDTTRFIYALMRAYAISHGTKVETRRFAAYNTQTRTAYISSYNGRMYKLEGGSDIETVTCGEDNIFFVDDDKGTHVEPDIGPHGMLLDRLTDINFAPSGLSGITPEQQRMALIIWLFALALPDLMPTKPLLLLEGTQGSGKSAAMQLIQLAIMGVKKPMIISKNKEDDFGVLLLRSPIAVFDNLDSYIEWIPDAICAYATSGQWTKRKLFSDDDEYTLKPHAFPAVASKNPASFRREDTADRCLILRLERRQGFTRMQKLEEQIAADRPRLFGEYLWYVNQIVNELRVSAADAEPTETFRMADFAALARVVARVIGWTEESVSGMMSALQNERDAFINEEDPLVELLQQWIAYRPKNGTGNVGRCVTATELHHELEGFATVAQVQWKHTPRTLMQKIRSPHVERAFHVEQGVRNGHKTFKFYRPTDARLQVVGVDETPEDEGGIELG